MGRELSYRELELLGSGREFEATIVVAPWAHGARTEKVVAMDSESLGWVVGEDGTAYPPDYWYADHAEAIAEAVRRTREWVEGRDREIAEANKTAETLERNARWVRERCGRVAAERDAGARVLRELEGR